MKKSLLALLVLPILCFSQSKIIRASGYTSPPMIQVLGTPNQILVSGTAQIPTLSLDTLNVPLMWRLGKYALKTDTSLYVMPWELGAYQLKSAMPALGDTSLYGQTNTPNTWSQVQTFSNNIQAQWNVNLLNNKWVQFDGTSGNTTLLGVSNGNSTVFRYALGGLMFQNNAQSGSALTLGNDNSATFGGNVIVNGTGGMTSYLNNAAGFKQQSSSTADFSAYGIGLDGSNTYIQAWAGGTGTVKPIAFYNNSVKWLNTDLTGNVTLSNNLTVNGKAYIDTITTNLKVQGTINADGSVTSASYVNAVGLYSSADMKVYGKSGWLTWATRNSAGAEVVYDLAYIGNILTSGNILRGTGAYAPIDYRVSYADYITRLHNLDTTNGRGLYVQSKTLPLVLNNGTSNVLTVDGSGNVTMSGVLGLNTKTDRTAILRGASGSEYAYLDFQKSTGTSVGYVGKGGGASDDVTLVAASGSNLKLYGQGALGVTVGASGAVTVAGNLTVSGTGTNTLAGATMTNGVMYQFQNTIGGWAAPYMAYSYNSVTSNANNTTYAPLYLTGSVLSVTATASSFSGDLGVNGSGGLTVLNSTGNHIAFKRTGNNAIAIIQDNKGWSFYNNTKARYDLSMDTLGNATIGGGVVIGGSTDMYGVTYHRGNISLLNKAGNGWLTVASRNTSGAEAVYDLNNIGTLTLGSGSVLGNYLKFSASGTTYYAKNDTTSAGSTSLDAVRILSANTYPANSSSYADVTGMSVAVTAGKRYRVTVHVEGQLGMSIYYQIAHPTCTFLIGSGYTVTGANTVVQALTSAVFGNQYQPFEANLTLSATTSGNVSLQAYGNYYIKAGSYITVEEAN